MDKGTFYVRTSIACFKLGKKAEANRIVEVLLKRWMDGYRGYVISSDLDDPDRSIYITFWDSEEAMVKAMNNLDEDSFNKLDQLSKGAVIMEFSKVDDHWLHFDFE